MASRYAFASILVAAMLAGEPAPAPAQCRLCTTPTTDVEQADSSPIQLEVDATLDFDRLVLLGQGSGIATLLPNGERNASGTIVTVSARAMVGEVTVRGQPGRAIRIEMPARIELYSLEGAAISVEQLETDLPGLPKLDSAGNFRFRFGGRLEIRGDADGEYRGDVPINVEYL